MSRSRIPGVAGVAAALLLGACVHATPVRPAPLRPARARALRCALLGTWEDLSVDGRPMKAMRLTFHFDAGGTGVYTQTPKRPTFIQSAGSTHLTWRLDGRNLTLTRANGGTVVYRIDRWSQTRMRWFNYSVSVPYVLARVGPAPRCP